MAVLKRLARLAPAARTAGLVALAALAGSPGAAEPPRPIPDAGTWMFVSELPGITEPVCTARTEGPEANTILLLNNTRVPILMTARPDWSGLEGQAEIGLSIDGAPPTRVTASMAMNLVIVSLSDETLLGRLRAARTIEWALPFGDFRANVEGLGIALDAVISCTEAAN